MNIGPKCTCNNPNDNEYFQGGYSYCPIHGKKGTSNTQLPGEFQKELDDLVMKHTLKLRNDNDYQIGYEKGVEKGIEIGATAYATAAYQAQQLLFRLASLVNAEQKPDEKFLTEIKTFLDGK